jgi:ribonucleoside-triphosphate reductase
MEKDIPYAAVNLPNDACACGFVDEIPNECPKCGGTDILRLRRVTGYLSNDYRHFNKGKQDEVEDREKHIKN